MRTKWLLSLFLMFFVCVSCIFASVNNAQAAFQTGDIFAAVNSGNINRYDSTGTFLETLNIGSSGYTTGMAFDASGNLYATGFSASRVAKFDTNGTLLNSNYLTTGLSTPESIVFDNSGNIYVGNLGSGIQKYDMSGNYVGNVIGNRVDWFDLTADQSTFYYGQEGTAVKTVSNGIPGTPGADFATGLQNAFAMRVLADNGLLVADRGDVKRFDSSGTLIQTYDVAGVDGWFALNLDPDATSFWSGSYSNDTLYKFDILAGNLLQTISTTGSSSNLYGVAVFGEITAGGPGPGHVVPEPSTFLLLGGGLVGLAFTVRRRRKE